MPLWKPTHYSDAPNKVLQSYEYRTLDDILQVDASKKFVATGILVFDFELFIGVLFTSFPHLRVGSQVVRVQLHGAPASSQGYKQTELFLAQ